MQVDESAVSTGPQTDPLFRRSVAATAPRRPPGLSWLQLARYVPALLRDRANALRRIAIDHGGVVRVPVPGKPFYLVTHPDGARRVLQTNAKNYQKSFDWKIVREFLGDGVITSHDDLWQHGRTAASPVSRRKFVASVVPTVYEGTRETIARWQAEGRRYIKAHQTMSVLTLDLFAKSMFRIDAGEDLETISKCVSVGLQYLDRRLEALVDWSAFLPTPQRRHFEHWTSVLSGVVQSWIDERRANPTATDDLLSMLIRASEGVPGRDDADRWVRDSVVTFLIAGHESAATVMTWCMYELATRPEIQARLLDEATAMGEPRSLGDLEELPFTDQVIRETMRLYPPVWSLGREAIEADELGEYTIPAGATVMVSPYVLHRRPEAWEDPEAFRPERFTALTAKGKTFVYFPFSSGPRFCPGERFAMAEMRILLTQLVRSYRLSVEPGRIVGLNPLISLRPKPDIDIFLEPR